MNPGVKYGEYLKTEYWAVVSKEVKRRAKFKCQVCNSPHDLNAHHRTYENRGHEMEHLDDLVCLCRRCHEIFHGKDKPKPTAPHAPEPKKRGIVLKDDYYNHEADLPDGEQIVFTRELVNRLKTKRGGFTNATLRAINIKKPLVSGWPRLLVGKSISREGYRSALEGREVFRSSPL